jgi:anaerobic selenocysteine-containing dehydrogenase
VPNGPRVARAFEQLDALISLDIYINETSRHAHVILPGVSPLEESHFDVPFPQFAYRNSARYSPAILPLPTAQPSEWQTMLTLAAIAQGQGAKEAQTAVTELDDARSPTRCGDRASGIRRSGAGAPMALRGPERLLDLAFRLGPYGDMFGRKPGGLTLAALAVRPEGVDCGALAPRIPEMLRTPSGKIELAPAPLLADLARAVAKLAEPRPDLVMIGRRQLGSNNSWMHNLPLLARARPLHAARTSDRRAAIRRDVRWTARVSCGTRDIVARVSVTDEVMPGSSACRTAGGMTSRASR